MCLSLHSRAKDLLRLQGLWFNIDDFGQGCASVPSRALAKGLTARYQWREHYMTRRVGSALRARSFFLLLASI